MDLLFNLTIALLGWRGAICDPQHDRSSIVRQAPGTVEIRSTLEADQFLIRNAEINDAVLEFLQVFDLQNPMQVQR